MTMRSRPGAQSSLRDDERWDTLHQTLVLISKVVDRVDATTQQTLQHRIADEAAAQTALRQIADLTKHCEQQGQEIQRLTRALADASDRPPINLDDPSLKHMTKDDLLRRLNHLGDLYREAVMRERAQQDAADAMRRERDEARKERDEMATQLHVVLTTAASEAPYLETVANRSLRQENESQRKEITRLRLRLMRVQEDILTDPQEIQDLVKYAADHQRLIAEVERLKTLVGEEEFETAHNWRMCSRREAIRQADNLRQALVNERDANQSLRSQVCEQRQQTQRLRVLLDEIGTRAQEGQE